MARDYTDFTFEMYRGDNQDFTLTILDPDGVTPLDITGWTVWMTAKLSVADDDTAAIFQRVSPSGGITLSDPINGIATIALVPANTATLTDARTTLVVDVQAKSSTGRVITPRTGKIVVVAEITRATT